MRIEAYRAARREAAVADISGWGKLLFRGPDRREVLNGLFSNDILHLQPGHGLLSCVLTPKGKLVSDFALYDLFDEMLSIQPKSAVARMIEALAKPLMLSETSIDDVSGKWSALLVLGPQTQTILGEECALPALAPYDCVRLQWQDRAIIALSYPRFALDGVILVTDHKERLETALDLESLDEKTLETLRIEAGLPAPGVDSDDDTLPLELSLESAISFDKGCYMGQETTARMRNFGHSNRTLVGLKLEKPTDPGASILLDDKPIGKLSSIAESPSLKSFLALALVRKEHSASGTRLAVEGAGAAEVVTLPVNPK